MGYTEIVSLFAGFYGYWLDFTFRVSGTISGEFIPKGKLINESAERVEEKSAAG